MTDRTLAPAAAAVIFEETGDIRVILLEGTSPAPPWPWPWRVFIALGIASMLDLENQDELTASFIKRLNRAVRQIAAQHAPETLRRHDLMRSLDPETATRN
jgi:hypothetical protein